MDYVSIILPFIGGLGMFIYGMQIMAQGLENAAGSKMKSLLEVLTKNKFFGVLLGAFITAVIQSSSATTVMVVGFVNAGIMNLTQAMGVIMGANIGTTVTGWLVSSVEWAKALSPANIAPVAVMIGVIVMLTGKRRSTKDISSIIVGFGILFIGITTMSDAVEPLQQSEAFCNLFVTLGHSPFLGIVAGALVTAVIQSSSASVGILQSLAAAGLVPFNAAVYIIMGQNIGTCVTAMISGIGASKNARRAALVHLYFNIIGTAVFMIVFYTVNGFIHFDFLDGAASAMGIAVVHSAFNVASTILLLPFSKVLVKLATLTIPDEQEKELAAGIAAGEEEFRLLDPRFLETPGYAVEQCRLVTTHMAQTAREGFLKAMELLDSYDQEKADQVAAIEDLVDKYEDHLGTYMVKVGSQQLSKNDSHTVSLLLHCIGDFERISDHAMNLMTAAKEMHDKNMEFSKKAEEELKVFLNAVTEILDLSVTAFENNDVKKASLVEPLEEVIDDLNTCVKANHIKRLQKGKCTIEQGFVLSDISTNLERVSDHCSNIAISVIEIDRDGFDAHGYLENLKRDDDPRFQGMVESYRKKYTLPA